MDREVRCYIVDEESLPLKRLHSARLVIPARNDHQSLVAARLTRSSRLDMVTTVPENGIIVRGDANTLEEIHRHQDVYCTRSAFVDAHGHELFLTNEVLVRFAETVSDAARRELCRKFNCIVVSDTQDIWRIRVADIDDDAPLDLANILSAESGVEFAEPNALQAATDVAEPQLGNVLIQNPWHRPPTGQHRDAIRAHVRTLEAWEIAAGSPRIRIVVRDRDINISDPEFIATDLSKHVDNHGDPVSNHDSSQGAVHLGITAVMRAHQGTVNTAPRHRIASLRAAGIHTWAAWAQAFNWATSHSEIITCSWRMSRNKTLSEAIKQTVRKGRSGKGMPIFWAAGHDLTSMNSFPANLSETIGVRPYTPEDTPSLHSPSPYGQYRSGVDFAVPLSSGTLHVETTDVRRAFGELPQPSGDDGNTLDARDFGDSWSATQWAAIVAALMLSVNNNLTAEQVRAIMRDTCEKIDQANAHDGDRGSSAQYGHGRLNAIAAVKRAQKLG